MRRLIRWRSRGCPPCCGKVVPPPNEEPHDLHMIVLAYLETAIAEMRNLLNKVSLSKRQASRSRNIEKMHSTIERHLVEGRKQEVQLGMHTGLSNEVP